MGVGIAIAGLAISAASAGYSAYSQNKAQKAQEKAMRNPGGELGQTMDDSGDYLKQNLKYDYLSGLQQLQLSKAFAQQGLSLYPQLAEAERKATTDQRFQDYRDLNLLGPRYMKGLERTNPGFKESNDALLERVRSAGDRTATFKALNEDAAHYGDVSPINQRLQGMAMDELDLGGYLSPDQERQVLQDTRKGFASRGLLYSDPAAVGEVMNLAGARQARLRERQGFAGNVNAAFLDEINRDRAFGSGVEALNHGELVDERGFLGSAEQIEQARLNPIIAMFTQRAGSPLMGTGSQTGGPNTTGTTASSLNSVLSYNSDAYGSNFNATQAAMQRGADSDAALAASGIKIGSSVGNAGLNYYMQNRTPTTYSGGYSIPNAGAVAGYTYTPSTGYALAA